ncbi:MerR family transcriptional regulator [Thermotoga profunda]
MIPKTRRYENGIRNYTEDDCRWIEFILCMRKAGVEIETLVEYTRLLQKGDETLERRRQLLILQRDKLLMRVEEMQKALDKLNLKIKQYEEMIAPIERNLIK